MIVVIINNSVSFVLGRGAQDGKDGGGSGLDCSLPSCSPL